MKIVIPGTLPSLNEIIDAAKGHWNNYREMKELYTTIVKLKSGFIPKLSQFDVTVTWYCPNKRKDKDNIMAGQKFIFDGLQAAGKVDNDGWKQIRDVMHRFEVDKHNPRVEVEITPVEAVSA